MKHLRVNDHCDCTHDIRWVAENRETCRIDRNYTERHEPTISGVSISVMLPGSDLWAEFAANDEGWMYVSDRDASTLPVVSMADGIAEVEASVNRWMRENLQNEGPEGDMDGRGAKRRGPCGTVEIEYEDIPVRVIMPASRLQVFLWLVTGGRKGKCFVEKNETSRRWNTPPQTMNCRCVIVPATKEPEVDK